MIAEPVTVWNAWLRLDLWAFDLDVWIGTALVAGAYWYGRRQLIAMRGPGAAPRSRAAMFYGGSAVSLVTLQSPLAWLGGRLLSAHMLHHMALLVVAAPLIAAATPWEALRAALPRSVQPSIERLAVAADGTGPIGRSAGVARSPVTAVVLFVGNLWLWHLPFAYDLTLRSPAVHEAEHALYLLTGVLFWSHAVGRSWLAARLPAGGRIGLLAAGMVAGWLLALVIAFQPAPIYVAYVFSVHTVSGLSPIDDQRIAAGLMWAVGMVPFNIAIALAIMRVLDAEEEAGSAADAYGMNT